MKCKDSKITDRYALVNDRYKWEEARRSDALATQLFALYQNTYSVKHLYQHHNKKILDALAKFRDLSKGRLLEIGCGFGNFLVDAYQKAREAQGIDLGTRNVEMARAILPPSVEVQVADAEALPFENEEFDYVVLKGLLHHLGKPDLALQEAYRVLKQGGIIAIFEGDSTAPYRRVILGIADLLGVCHETSFFRHLAPDEIATLLVRTGFSEIQRIPISGLFVPMGLRGIGNERPWKVFDAIENWLERRAPLLFRWHILYTARKPKTGESDC